MTNDKQFEVIIVGGSYSGLAAALALGRALRRVLIIDSGKPCNAQTPHSHNFLTQDGKTPAEISTVARNQLKKYTTIHFLNGLATKGIRNEHGFEIEIDTGERFMAKKLIFATGIRDIMLDIPGYAECWGVSVLHCPYCHGYEVRDQKTGILGNGEYGFEFSGLISNWTDNLTLYTNGVSTLTSEQTFKLSQHQINIEEAEIEQLENKDAYLQKIIFKNGKSEAINVLYSRSSFKQHCSIPESLGCELNEVGYIKTDNFQKTTTAGVFACGDNTTRMRSVANAVAMGTTAGMTVNKEMIEDEF